ncbi:MAG: glycosyltransferase [Aquificae bacterium]|nr:glycosyltransferase [Aquificota bacterium]
MRVALYVNHLSFVSSTARIAKVLAQEFKALGHEPFLVVNRPPVELATEFPVFVLKRKSEPLRAYELGKLLRNADACLAFMRPQSVIAAQTRLLYPSLKTALVGSVHNADNYLKYNKTYQLPFRLLTKFLLERLDRLVVISEGVKEDLREAFFIKEEKLTYVPNPVETEWVRSLADEPLPEKDEELFKRPVVINVARHERQKGLSYLLKAFARALKEAELNLVLVGEGRETPYLKRLAEELKIKPFVHFLGWRKNPFPLMKRARVFALTSLWEGLGMVLLESFTLGLPTLAYETRGGHVELLRGVAPLIPFPDEEAYARELLGLVFDEGKRARVIEAQYGKLKAFEPERVARAYEELFKALTR